MRIEIEIPKEFEGDYDSDRFGDFFSRAMIDIETMQGMSGRYEIETAEMIKKAFAESKKVYNVKDSNGDLISRNALIERMRKYKTVYGVPMTKRDEQMVHFMIGHIKNLEPTAYDPEAVVAKLEAKWKGYEEAGKVFNGTHGSGIRLSYALKQGAILEAMEIVRNGGKE